jgi:hypothetical protein
VKPFVHAKNSAKKYGGAPEDYMPIHDFIDSSKAHGADMRHSSIAALDVGHLHRGARSSARTVTISAGRVRECA